MSDQDYNTLEKVVKHLKYKYVTYDEDYILEDNAAFIALERMAENESKLGANRPVKVYFYGKDEKAMRSSASVFMEKLLEPIDTAEDITFTALCALYRIVPEGMVPEDWRYQGYCEFVYNKP